MKRVAVIMGKMHSGGKKNLVMEYYRHIDRSKYQFDFICDDDSNAIPDKEIEALGGRVYRVTSYKKIWMHMRDLDKIFRQNKYEIMHAYNNTMNLFPLLVAKKHNVKVRISESISTGNKGEKQTYIKYILRILSSYGTNYLMANGKESALFQFGRKKYNKGEVSIFKTVIDARAKAYNSVLRAKIRKEMDWEDKIVLGFIARFVPQKNPIFLIEVFQEIHKKEPHAVLAIIGFGPLEDKIQQKIKDYHLEDYVCLVGQTEDIYPYYNAFDGFLLPSLYEGLPVVGVEAQAVGLPTIMSTAVTEETTACELAHYISLSTPTSIWADQILAYVKENMPKRRSYVEELIAAGFDSHEEAIRLQKFYDVALNA